MKKTLVATFIFGALFAASLPAQTATPADEKEPKVAARKERQQKRIANGVKSGQLTAQETAHLENKEARINRETRTDRAANDGKLTTDEKKQINHQQTKVSGDIYQQKHDAQTQQK